MLWLLLLPDCTSWLHSIPHNAGNYRRFKRGMDAQPQSFLRHYNIARESGLDASRSGTAYRQHGCSTMKKLLLGFILVFCIAIPLAVPIASQAQVVIVIHRHHHHYYHHHYYHHHYYHHHYYQHHYYYHHHHRHYRHYRLQ
jgi:hypothetical protein